MADDNKTEIAVSEKISEGLYRVTEQMSCMPSDLRTASLGEDFNADQIASIFLYFSKSYQAWVWMSRDLLTTTIANEYELYKQGSTARIGLTPVFLKNEWGEIKRGMDILLKRGYLKEESREGKEGFFLTSSAVIQMKKLQEDLQLKNPSPAETMVKV